MMKGKLTIDTETTREGVLLSTRIGDVLYKRQYIGYTLRKAKELFREYVRNEQNNQQAIQ